MRSPRERVGHAYLFTGARGVGKTSTARILAKALNCVHGPTATPCGECDICRQIAGGEDVDVLEIDGASNRGIDEIRQLRSNVGIRPSRARFKIYIIDEVHMLTKEAFNALLKTLEEPPEHVKFIFCTTEPSKIPDHGAFSLPAVRFLPGRHRSDRGATAAHRAAGRRAAPRPAALELLARRAAGSMRDSQSLLEQLLAFVGDQITVDDVHAMLGTAREERLSGILQPLIQRDAASALSELGQAVAEGVDPGQLAEQLVGSLRDMMVVLVGCPGELLIYHAPSELETADARRPRAGGCKPYWPRSRCWIRPSRGCDKAFTAESCWNWPWCGSLSWRSWTNCRRCWRSCRSRPAAANRHAPQPRRRRQKKKQ